jgi:hypothetical protein
MRDVSAMSKGPATPREFGLLLRVLAVLVILRLLLPFVKLKRLVRWLGPTQPPRAADPLPLQTAARYTDALLGRMRYGRRGNCLPRTLTLFFFAARAGLPVQIHCGVRRMGQTLEGHAWLSLHGHPFLERGDPPEIYAVIFSYPDGNRGEAPAEASASLGGPS